MKLGVLTNVVANKPFPEALDYFQGLGIQMVEVGCGGYPGKDHADPDILLHDDEKLHAFQQCIADHGMEISALSAHGNPIHPNREIAKKFDDDMHKAVLLAEKLGVTTLNTFSGCPGDSENSARGRMITARCWNGSGTKC